MSQRDATAAAMLPVLAVERPRLRLARPLARQAKPWYRISAKAAADPEADGDGEGAGPTVDGDTTIIDIYDEIGWFGTGAADFVRDLRGVDTPKIELHLNSPGGDVFDAIAIFNGLRQHKAQVHVLVDSLAASAASFVAMAGDKITAMANAMLMIHDPLGLVIGNAADMRELADLLDKHGDNIASIYAARAGGEVSLWRERMLAETWYLADEAYKAGLVDEVAEADGRPVSDAWDLSVFARAGRGQAPDPALPAVTDTVIGVHHTDTVDEPWDAAAVEKALPDGDQKSWKTVYAWYDSSAADGDGDGLPDAKSAWKFPHHTKTGGPANLGGARSGLARVPGSSIPEGDKAGVKRHLQAHLDDAPQDAGSTTGSGNGGRSRDHPGEPASWHLPRPAGKEQPKWARL